MDQVPITLITGFLGAGKTTLLNRILTEQHKQKIAVIVNEFGEIGIDNQLIARQTDGVVELVNGCICCSMRDGTFATLLQLMDKRDELGAFDRVVIETTGLANPLPFIRGFLSKPLLKKHFSLDGVVTVVDALHIEMQLDASREATDQIVAADVVLLNKRDMVRTDILKRIEKRIKLLNPIAKIVRTTRTDIDLAILGSDPGQTPIGYRSGTRGSTGASDKDHSHDKSIASFVLREDRPLDMNKVTRWIGEELMLNSQNLLRYKGILSIAGKDEKMIFQGVHTHFENTVGEKWQPDEQRRSEVVVIGRDLNEAAFRASFKHCVA